MQPLWMVLVIFLLVNAACTHSNSKVLRFGALDTEAAWKHHVFSQATDYSVVGDGHAKVLRAISKNSASALYKQVSIDLWKTPYIQWRWKIENALSNLPENTKQGDDFAARVYVVIAAKPFRFKPRSLNYVWSGNAVVGQHWVSPYSKDVVMLSLQDSNQYAGQWITEKRNLKEDLEKYFGETIRYVEAIAIMTDTDNSHSQATAYYQDIVFSKD